MPSLKTLHYFLIALTEQLYGKKGAVSLSLFLNSPGIYTGLKKVYIDFWGDKKAFYVEDIKEVGRKIVIKFRRFDTTRESEVLLGRDVFIDDEEVKALPGKNIFINDLIGSEVFIEGSSIGIIKDVMKTKANDVLLIENVSKKEILIPFVLNFIEKFNAAEKKLILNLKKEFL